MQIETWQLADLNPAPYNPRKDLKPGDPEYERLKKSIQTFDYVDPIIVNRRTGRIVGGHQRYKLLRDLGYAEAAVSVVDLDETQEKALNVALNQTGGTWDEDALATLLAELTASLDDIEVTGFGADEVAALLAQVQERPQEDPGAELPPVPDEPITRLGDLWQLGRHRLLCGDSARGGDWERLMGTDLATLIVTDPPYGVSFEGAKYNPRAKTWGGIAGDDRRGTDQRTFICSAFRAMQKHAISAAPVYCWSDPLAEGCATLRGLLDAGIHIQSQIVWVKNALVLGQADWQWCHEIAWYGWTPGTHHLWNGGRAETTVWAIDKDANSSYMHPMQKPVELYAKAIRASSRPGDVIMDGFTGSGASLIAAEQEGRCMRAMELDPHYCDVIIARWERLTGQKAVKLDGASDQTDPRGAASHS